MNSLRACLTIQIVLMHAHLSAREMPPKQIHVAQAQDHGLSRTLLRLAAIKFNFSNNIKSCLSFPAHNY